MRTHPATEAAGEARGESGESGSGHVVALQVAFEKANFEAVFSLDRL
jgi:hypothetical protein